MKLQTFLEMHFVDVARVTRIHENPNMVDASDGMQHYRCVLERPFKRNVGRKNHPVSGRAVILFSQGSAHSRPPTAHDIIECLVSDALTRAQAATFEEWCSDLGYDSDSRKALRTYEAIGRNTQRLKALFGNDETLYAELLACDDGCTVYGEGEAGEPDFNAPDAAERDFHLDRVMDTLKR